MILAESLDVILYKTRRFSKEEILHIVFHLEGNKWLV